MPCSPHKVDLNAKEMDGEMEKQKEADKEESDAVDVFFAQHAETAISHQRAAEKQRYNTLGYQKKKQKLPADFSTVSKGTSSNIKSRGALMQLFNQGSEKTSAQEERGVAGALEQVEALKQTLKSFPVPAELSWKWGEGDKADILEKSWTDIVHSHESMSKTQRHQQEALWELIHTEFIYINKLTIVNDLVLAALKYVHQHGFLLEVTPTQLFSNLPNILNAHKLFWQEVMYPMLKNVRLTGQPFDPLQLEPGCLQFAERFPDYVEYCLEEERNVEFTRRQLETNSHFHAYLMWVETHPQCMRMRLGDMQAKPHQRITKYPLLLKAILKTTQDPHTQHALRCMLAGVGEFLDSINDHLQFKDDELALSVHSQKIEGYEVQGFNEEIDKYIQEFCHFNLKSPIRGIGPKVIRKLLLEETLKVKGRKDSKLEVVVLLFTDVLLLTKTQKKSEKHKVVRPPLSLERIRCAELKDGYSFVLVEVSDLGCAISVYSVSAPSTESCTAWVSAIHQAQEALETLRKAQNQSKPKMPSDQVELEESETLPFPSTQSTEDREEQPEAQAEFTNDSSQIAPGLKFTANHLESREDPQVGSKVQNSHSQAARTSSTSKQMQNRDKEFTDEQTQDSEEKQRSESRHQEADDVLSGVINERRVTWSHITTKSSDTSNEGLKTNKSNDPHPLLVGGLMENTTPSQTSSSKTVLQSGHKPAEPAISNAKHRAFTSVERAKQQNLNYQSQESDSCQESLQSGEEGEVLSESSRFSRKLKSPRLRRKRPMNSQSYAPTQGSRRMSDGAESVRLLCDRNSPTNSDSDGNNSLRRPSNSSSEPQDAHLVLKLASLKRISLDLHAFSEPELFNKMPQNSLKIPQMKSQRSASTPDVYLNTQSFPLCVPNRLCPSPPPGLDPQLHPSPLQGLLDRAKERDRERGLAKRDGKPTEKNVNPLQNRIYISNSPSSSHNEGERETEGEEQELFRQQGKHYLQIECSVDGPENERRYSPVTPLGVSVDWPGWCFDDEELREFWKPYDGTIDWWDHAVTTEELQQTLRHEDGEYSEV
ncbi:hypothetical protein SRHO_G00052730 [Serrasalmus rhombeus]